MRRRIHRPAGAMRQEDRVVSPGRSVDEERVAIGLRIILLMPGRRDHRHDEARIDRDRNAERTSLEQVARTTAACAAAAGTVGIQSFLVMTASRYSLGRTSVPSLATLNSSSRA